MEICQTWPVNERKNIWNYQNMSIHMISPSCQDSLRGNYSYIVSQNCVVDRKFKSKYARSSERRVHRYFILKKVLRALLIKFISTVCVTEALKFSPLTISMYVISNLDHLFRNHLVRKLTRLILLMQSKN